MNDCDRLRAVAAVALPLGARFSGRTVTRADWLWASALTAAIAGQSAFQVGALQASLPATTVMEPLVASPLGFVVLGEYLDADRKVTAVLVVALIAVVMAAVARGAAVVEDTGTDPAQPLSRSRR
ncbi:DMT family transporter [Rhodococcus opacus]|uniref:DMT family transporter n=1 Tax=Rhodococcus opacus TaxID=37919 RepID=UPI001F5986E5|nr:DMT family transporter [Rhodococcus opacus]UNM99105.1 DMT family transporter [Rhodococcus opacus]WKN55479.1 DMT family transporter [Rhodococcus opacus]